MSKITPKNLHYDSSLPPFLARLQNAHSSSDGRHEYAVARPKKPRNAEEEAEDEPVYFDEGTGETLTKGEWEENEKLERKEGQVEGGKEDGAGGNEGGGASRNERGKEKVAGIGGGKKRKAGKIVGANEEGQVSKPEAGLGPGEKKGANAKVEKGKSVKKAKKIKLSFDE